LKVVFDTNSVFSERNKFLNSGVHKIIKTTPSHQDLIVTWCLPHVVRHERQYHLQRLSREFFQSHKRLNKQLRVDISITEEDVNQSIGEEIEQSVQDLKIHVLQLDTTKVDWERLILDSVYRRPPFANDMSKKLGMSEKGFRDALIAETFLQTVESSPTRPRVCRIALVSTDERLIEAVEDRTRFAENVYIARGAEELEELIDTLVSRVGEKFIDQAKRLFFTSQDQVDSLYKREKILNQIKHQYENSEYKRPGAKHVKTLIGGTRLKQKKVERLFWITRVTLRVEDRLSATPEVYTTGHITYQVTWSVAINNKDTFENPRIESIDYLKTTWE
jgi:hypothetical protein